MHHSSRRSCENRWRQITTRFISLIQDPAPPQWAVEEVVGQLTSLSAFKFDPLTRTSLPGNDPGGSIFNDTPVSGNSTLSSKLCHIATPFVERSSLTQPSPPPAMTDLTRRSFMSGVKLQYHTGKGKTHNKKASQIDTVQCCHQTTQVMGPGSICSTTPGKGGEPAPVMGRDMGGVKPHRPHRLHTNVKIHSTQRITRKRPQNTRI